MKIRDKCPRLMQSVLINAHSICNKTDLLLNFCNMNSIDIAFLTEKWMREINKPTQSLLSAPPYNFVNFPRTGRGGGLGILYHSTSTISTLKHIVTTSMELVIIIITRRYHPAIKFFIIYRPPKLDFKKLIRDFIEHVTPNTTQNTIILGYLNIHVNKIILASSTDFFDLMENNNLKQHIDFPTHTCGNIFYQITTRTNNTIESDFEQSILKLKTKHH